MKKILDFFQTRRFMPQKMNSTHKPSLPRGLNPQEEGTIINMDSNEKYQYWIKHAKYDLDTADCMFQTRRWIYVMFMCQQAIEKSVKGIYGLYLSFETIPRTHNIRRLINDFANKLSQEITEKTYTLFDQLTRYYLNNRYPDYIDDLISQTNEIDAKMVLEQTKEVFAWLQTLKP